MSESKNLLEVEDLKVHFPVLRGIVIKSEIGSIKAVDGVSFALERGKTLGLVGESGCGKSTTGLAVLRMLTLSGGRIRFEGNDITEADAEAMRPIRRRMQMVYQDPYGSLNPRMTVADIVGEPLVVHRIGTAAEQRDAVAELISLVGLKPDMATRYPHEFSGGQRQRIGIARALALRPSLIVCDEPVSALDVSIQAQVVNLFQELQDKLGLSYLFIAHDLAVVRHISERVAVMYLGRIVETAERTELYKRPLHPYTQALLAAVPIPSPAVEAGRAHAVVQGEVPSPMNPPRGCHFHPRCPQAVKTCSETPPKLRDAGNGHAVACHLYGG